MSSGVGSGWMPRIGQEFAGYRLDALSGSGGMSVVYQAEHLALGRTVALKLLHPQLSEDEGFRERFLRESRHVASLDHPNIIPIFEAGEEQGVFYIAMRFVEGSDLKSLLRAHGTLPLERTVSIVTQVAAALGAAHAKGLVHRDVKPANILIASGVSVDESDHAYLCDFGVAKLHASSELTHTGVFVGTTDYAAPEQIESREIDGRADIYALGCVLYQCLTGAPAYQRDSEAALMYAHLLEPPPRPTVKQPGLPASIDDVVARAMAKSPDDRYPTTRELAAALRDAAASAQSAPAAAVSDDTRLAPPAPSSSASSDTQLAPGSSASQPTILAPAPRDAAPPPTAPPPAPPAPAAPAAAAVPPAAEKQAPPPPPTLPPSSSEPAPDRKRPSKVLVGIGALLLLCVVAAVLAVVLTRGSSNDAQGTTTATTSTAAVRPSDAQGITAAARPLIPTEFQQGCWTANAFSAAAWTIICAPPASKALSFYPDNWMVTSYSTAEALATAYEAELTSHDVPQDGSRCESEAWPEGGAAQSSEGQRFCYFEGEDAVIVWTHAKRDRAAYVNLVGITRTKSGSHENLFKWWEGWRDRIGKCTTEGCVAKLS